jgi:SAM-dependent methyltransferase
MPKTSPAPAAALPGDILLSDAAFDSAYDDTIRKLSAEHWTPVRVAARAAQLLILEGATRILDVGSGVGKFCIVGALSTEAEFVGVERRSSLVEIARRTALRFGTGRATFVHANADAFSFDGFNGVYLFNPYHEQIGALLNHIDDDVERSRLMYSHFVRATMLKLAAMAPPVAVVTLGGFGGTIPSDFDFLGDEPAGSEQMELWVKK